MASLVGQQHTPVTETELQAVDLYLVDDASFPEYKDELEAQKREQEPVFCPVVLVRRDRTSVRIDFPESNLDDRLILIDEVLDAPVEKEILFRRLSGLLSHRRGTRELKEQNERLETFANVLRHELRNPLTVLIGYIEIARQEGDPEAFDRCQTAINRMGKLIEDAAAILGEGISMEMEPISLETICEESWDVITEPEAQIEVHTTQRIYADRDRLQQMLENLFRNAVEHGRSDVTTTVNSLNDGFVIEDDGPGISEEEREAVFEEGYSTTGAGSGIGLAVVKAICDRHGWSIRVTDGTEGGARFEISGVREVEE